MTNGGVDQPYRKIALAVAVEITRQRPIGSPNGGGGWAEFTALEVSTGTGFRSEVWGAGTAIHMRNGGRDAPARARPPALRSPPATRS